MNRFHCRVILGAWFATSALLAAASASAEPHAPPPAAATVAVVTPDAEAWLERLEGRFRLDGVIHHQEIVTPDRDETDDAGFTVHKGQTWHLNGWDQPIQGKADCINFGSGPGMQCVVNVVWPETWRVTGKAELGGVSDLSPAMILAGVAPTTGGIRFLLVDHKGLAHPGSTALSGDSVTTNPPCVNTPGVQRCKQVITLTAKANAKAPQLVFSTDVYFMRNKTDRKQFLEKIKPSDPYSPMESSTEWVEETLDVSFALNREPQTEAGASKAAPAKGSK